MSYEIPPSDKILVRHPCNEPNDPPANEKNEARWICPDCQLVWVWRPPIEPLPRVRTRHYGFLWLKSEKVPVPQEGWPGRWTYNPEHVKWVPQDSTFDKG